VARVFNEQVLKVTGDPSSVDAEPAIAVANLLVDELLGGQSLTEARLTQIELYLSAHFVSISQRDGPLAAQVLGEATERYFNIYGAGFSSTRFGQQAMILDTSGILAEESSRAQNPGKKDAEFQVI